jgi:hypothetical protein
LHLAGRLLRCAGGLAGQLLGGFRGPRQGCGGRLELCGGSRNIGDDGADRGFETIGEANELAAARRAGCLVMGILGRGVALGLGDGLQLELFDRPRHLAKFIPAPQTRQHDVEIAAGELAHRLAHRRYRPGNSLAQHQGQHCAKQKSAGRNHQNQTLGLADDGIRLRFKSLLIGEQVGLHRVRALHDRVRGLGHFGDEFVDRFGILDEFAKRLPIFFEQSGCLLESLQDPFIARRYRP